MKHIVGFSGGIDSQAACGVVLDLYGPDNVLITNSPAGDNEHPATVEHVRWYSDNVHPVIICGALISDIWKTPGAAEARGYDSSANLDFGLMIKIKKRPPSRKAQFCTEILKLKPQKRWIEDAFSPTGQYAGDDYCRYTGVRRDESAGRSDTPDVEWDTYFDCELRHIIADWPKQRCFDYVRGRGEQINPLYSLGFNRVGCAPCINSSKEDVRNWVLRAPDMLDKVRVWEEDSGYTFFPPMVPGLPNNNTIDQVIEWAMTSHGGRQQLFPIMHERESCESKYGLCE